MIGVRTICAHFLPKRGEPEDRTKKILNKRTLDEFILNNFIDCDFCHSGRPKGEPESRSPGFPLKACGNENLDKITIYEPAKTEPSRFSARAVISGFRPAKTEPSRFSERAVISGFRPAQYRRV